MKSKDGPVIEPLDLMSVSSSSMSGYDIDLVDVEIELQRERFRYPHIIVGEEERHPWEHDERWHKCFISLKIENYFTFCSLQFWMAMIVLNFN